MKITTKRKTTAKRKPKRTYNPAKPWATAHARDAYENHRGERAVFQLDEWTVIYDAHPYRNDPSRREREIEALREWASGEGIPELAFSIWPKTGEEKGYSFSMILDTERSLDVHAALDKIIRGQRPTVRRKVLPFVPRPHRNNRSR